MRVIARSRLELFWKKYQDSEQQLKSWYHEAKRATWQTPQHIKAQYRSASILKGRRVVFNICGNKYRLVCEVLFGQGILFIKFIETHKQYDAINAETYDEQTEGNKDSG
ncbi:MAG: type II toxin-antitoxin system HigB family toxin [Spirochaetia bacterium]